MLPELLVGMGEEGAPPQFGTDATGWITPGQAGTQFHAEAGFRIATVLADAHLQGGEQGSAVGQGERANRPQAKAEAGDVPVGRLQTLLLLRRGPDGEHLSGGGEAQPFSTTINEQPVHAHRRHGPHAQPGGEGVTAIGEQAGQAAALASSTESVGTVAATSSLTAVAAASFGAAATV